MGHINTTAVPVIGETVTATRESGATEQPLALGSRRPLASLRRASLAFDST